MKRPVFWNRLFNSGGNGISVFVGTALIAVIAIVITACPGAADTTSAEPKHTVSYNVNEGEGTPEPATETVSDGETIATAPTGISKPGYTLNTAWNTQADGTGEFFLFGDGGTAVTKDITLYAQWANQQHTVSYDINEGDGTPVPATQEVNHNDIIATAPTVSRPGYALNAVWNTKADGTGESFKFGNGGTAVTADITLYAQWTIQFTVSYNANEGAGTPEPATQTVNDGETIAKAPTGISRPGYTLNTAWNTQADGTGEFFLFGDGGTAVTKDITLYAQWANQQHTVSYDINEGDGTPVPATQEVNHNDIIATAPTVSRPGYALNAAWNTKADGTGNSFKFGDGGTPVTEDIILYAQWIKQHTVSYNVNEGDSTAPNTETVEDGGTFTKPADPTRSGHVFTGWFDTATGGNEYNFGTAATADITLYAQWTIITYTVSYNFNRGDSTEPSTETVEHGGTATRPTTDPTWAGYTFTGWFDAATGGDAFDFGTVVTEDITLYAQWTIKQYTVSYNVNQGEGTPNPETQTVNHGETIAAAPTSISNPGHTLNTAWNTKADGTGESFLFGDGGTPVREDITLYAQWANQQHTVSYHANGGDGTPNPATQEINHNDIIATAPTVSRNGYTLNAQWNTQADGKGDSFTFGSGGTPVTEDIELYAQWTIIQYTVSYHANGGEGTPNPATQKVDHDATIATAPTVSRPGYALNAVWNTQANGQGTPFIFGTTQVRSDMDLYAQWSIQYTVIYHANEGDDTPNPATQAVADGDTIATAPTVSKTGYALNAQWNTQADGKGDSFTFGSGGTPVTEDIELYAQWTIKQYTVSYNFNRGDSTEPSTETVEHGGTATRPTTDPTWTGYAFTGWFDAQAGGNEFVFGNGGTAVTADITLYAQWTPILTVSGLSPADGSSTTDTTPTFNWNAVPGAAGYELSIAASQSELENAATVSVTGTTYTPSAALTIGQTHYWRVRAVDMDGQKGGWSVVHSLEVVPQGFVHVAGGTFQMGSTESEADSDESPVHSVTVDSFYMAETEVTHRQYLAFLNDAGVSATGQLNGNEVIDMDDSDVAFSHEGTRFSFAATVFADNIDCPVIEETWYGAVEYSNWLSEQEGLTKAYSISGASVTWNQSANGYRLPTEAEWEYAARGGAQSNGYKYSGSNDVNEVGWYWDNAGGKTHSVKGKKANELGLYDMSGNVWEWCWDWYDSDYYSSSPENNPTGPSSRSYRVLHGGSWSNDGMLLRSANRDYDSAGISSNNLGFRLALRTVTF